MEYIRVYRICYAARESPTPLTLSYLRLLRMSLRQCSGRYLLIFIAICALGRVAQAQQSDAENFAEGRVALDKHNDCDVAYKALNSVSTAGQQEPMWIFYMAKTSECLKRFDKALELYRRYDQAVPGQQQVLDKIAEMRYNIRKKSDQDAQNEAARVQAEKAAAESAAKREQAAAEGAAKRQRVNDYRDAVSDLKKAMEGFGDFSYTTGTNLDASYKLAVRITGCAMHTTESIHIEHPQVSADLTMEESTPLSEVNPDTIRTDYVSGPRNKVNGWFFTFDLKDGAKDIKHEENTTSAVASLNGSDSSHLNSARYYADNSEDAEKVRDKFARVVEFCSQTSAN